MEIVVLLYDSKEQKFVRRYSTPGILHTPLCPERKMEIILVPLPTC